MKRLFVIITALAFLISTVFAVNGAAKLVSSVNRSRISSRYTVVIDAGHGGKDAGTSGVDGTAEKDINLQIALILRDFLSVSGINVKMVREDDTELYPEGSDKNRSDLYNRLDFVNSIPDSVLISIHQNHYIDESAVGTQIWYSPNDGESKTLADLVLKNVKMLLQNDNQRINKESDDSYYLLYKASVPSIMIECGFMSNTEENSKLKNSVYQKDFAFTILTGICGEV